MSTEARREEVEASRIVQKPERAGRSVLLAFVDDLDARVAHIAERGLSLAEQETYSNGVRKVTYRDPDGNEIGNGGGLRVADRRHLLATGTTT